MKNIENNSYFEVTSKHSKMKYFFKRISAVISNVMNPRSLLSLGPVKSSTFFLEAKNSQVSPSFKLNGIQNSQNSLCK